MSGNEREYYAFAEVAALVAFACHSQLQAFLMTMPTSYLWCLMCFVCMCRAGTGFASDISAGLEVQFLGKCPGPALAPALPCPAR